MKRIIVILSIVSANAFALTGIGVYDCGEWFSAKRSNAQTWLLGYLSGVNSGVSDYKEDPLSRLRSAEQAYLWMDNYCRSNPLSTVAHGGVELFIELKKMK